MTPPILARVLFLLALCTASGLMSPRTPFFYCRLGQYKSGDFSCPTCPDGYVMPELRHAHRKCFSCKTIQEAYLRPTADAELATAFYCNATHVSLPACRSDEFLDLDGKGGCTPCRNCEMLMLHAVHSCSKFTNTMCCPSPKMVRSYWSWSSNSCLEDVNKELFCCCPTDQVYVKAPNGYDCVNEDFIIKSLNKSWNGLNVEKITEPSCSTNQYMVASTKQCMPCPKCTYLNKKGHRDSSCNMCTATHPKIAYCPNTCLMPEPNVPARLFISGLIVVTLPIILVPMSLALVEVAKNYGII